MKRQISITCVIMLMTTMVVGCSSTKQGPETTVETSQNVSINAAEETSVEVEANTGDDYTNIELTDRIKDRLTIEEDIKAEYEAGGYTLEEPLVVQDPYGVSPLTALICFDTDDEDTVTVTVKGKDNYSDISHLYNIKEKSHTIPVYGLYAGIDNTVTIELGSGKSTELVLTTEPLPSNCSAAQVKKCTNPANFEGLTFASPTSGGGLYVIGYDVNGDIRWFVPDSFASGYELTRIDNGHMVMASGRIAEQPYYGTGLMEMDALGKIYKEYDISGAFHHDFKYLENGNILICSQVTKTGCVEDTIIEIKADTGELVRIIDLKDILPWQEPHSVNYKEKDWFHNNSVDFDKANNAIILSGRHIDGVISIDYDTTELNWILGSPDGWDDEWQKYFFIPQGDNFEWSWAQHSARVNPDGSIFIFDNGNNKSKSKDTAVPLEDEYSRGVIYDIDLEAMTISQRWEFGKERGVDFYSMYISKVQWIDDGNYIVHSGGIVKNEDGTPGANPFAPGLVQSTSIVEIDMDGSDANTATEDDVVYELEIAANTFRSNRMDVYADNESYKLCEAGQLLGSLDETITIDGVEVPEMAEAVLGDGSEIAAALTDVKATNEPDRIVIEGALADPQEDTEVDVILKGASDGAIDKVYKGTASKLFNQISKIGMNGDYNIWIMVDGKTIDTGYKMHF